MTGGGPRSSLRKKSEADLETANGQMWSAEQLNDQFVGMPFAGALIAMGMALPFGVDMAMLVLAAGLVWLISLHPAPPSGQHFVAALREGIGFMCGDPALPPTAQSGRSRRSGRSLAAALFAVLAAAMLGNVITVSWRQRRIPSALLGRVNSICRFFCWGSMPLGTLAGGAVVSILEPAFGREIALRAPFPIAAACCAGLLVYAVFRLRLE